MSSIVSNQQKAGFVLDAWNHSLVGNKDEFLSCFSSDVLVSTVSEVNEKNTSELLNFKELSANEGQIFTPIGKINQLRLTINFNSPTTDVQSFQLATLKANGNTVVLHSTANEKWDIEEQDHKLKATALLISQKDVVGKIEWKAKTGSFHKPIIADLKTRLWKHLLELQDSLSLSNGNGSTVDPAGLQPEDASTVLQYWSASCTNNQEIIRECLQKNSYTEELTVCHSENARIVDIQSLSLNIFNKENGVGVIFEQSYLLEDGTIVNKKGAQKWKVHSFEERQKIQLQDAKQKAQESKDRFKKLALEAKLLNREPAEVTVENEISEAYLEALAQSVILHTEESQEPSQEMQQQIIATSKKLAEEALRYTQSEEESELAKAKAQQSLFARTLNVLTLGWLYQPAIKADSNTVATSEKKPIAPTEIDLI